MKVISKMSLASVLLVVFVLSCGAPASINSVEAYKKTIHDADNGLVKESTIDNVEFKVSYRPTDLMVMRELKPEEKNDKEELARLRNKYGKYLYFTLHISADGDDLLAQQNSSSEYSNLLQTFSFGMEQKVHLLNSNNDKVPMADYTYARTFGMSGSTSFLFAFDKEEIQPSSTLTFVIEDLGFMNKTPAKFDFDMSAINDSPQLKW